MSGGARPVYHVRDAHGLTRVEALIGRRTDEDGVSAAALIRSTLVGVRFCVAEDLVQHHVVAAAVTPRTGPGSRTCGVPRKGMSRVLPPSSCMPPWVIVAQAT